MSPIIQFLKALGPLLRGGKMSYGDALTRFRAQFGRPAEGMEKAAIMKEIEKAPANVVDITSRLKNDWRTQRSGFKRQHPEVTKKVDEDPTSAMYDRHIKEIEGIDQGQGMGFYREMGDIMKKHRREELELEYDTMYNKILDKAKRIESDPLPLLEAELGTKLTGKETTDQLLDLFSKRPKKASGGIARVGMMMGGFTKAEVLIQMLKNTLKGSKDPYVKKTFPTFIKEIQADPSIANNENVWKQFTTGLPKNQRLVVHSDDSVDFFTQSEFGPHNIEKTLEFQKKHNLSRDQANKILQMEPEDRVLEMKRLETIRNRTKNAYGGIAGELHLNRPGYKGGALVKLLNLLKGSGKKTYYRGEPLIKNFEQMKNLEEFLKKNKLRNTLMPETFRGRWFTHRKDIADIYANPEPGLNIIKKVELTPKEIEFGRKLLKKSKTGMEIFGTNIVLPKKKVKDIKTDVIATIMSNIKKPFVKKAEGGIAGQLHLNRPGYRYGRTAKKKKEKKEYRMPPMFMFPNWREPANFPYKSLEDIPEEVLEMLRKDPVFDLDTFLNKVAWSDPDKTRIQEKLKGDDEAWGWADRMGNMFLNYQHFGKKEPIAEGLLTLKSPTDQDKVQTILHEMRHAKMGEPWFWKSKAIPEWVRKYEEAGGDHYLDKDIKDKHKKYRETQKDVSGEELYVRYLDQLYGDVAEKGDIAGSDYKPYFDKILRDHWKPHAKAYREILEAEKAEMSKPVFRKEFKNRKDYPLKSGGLAKVLGV